MCTQGLLSRHKRPESLSNPQWEEIAQKFTRLDPGDENPSWDEVTGFCDPIEAHGECKDATKNLRKTSFRGKKRHEGILPTRNKPLPALGKSVRIWVWTAQNEESWCLARVRSNRLHMYESESCCDRCSHVFHQNMQTRIQLTCSDHNQAPSKSQEHCRVFFLQHLQNDSGNGKRRHNRHCSSQLQLQFQSGWLNPENQLVWVLLFILWPGSTGINLGKLIRMFENFDLSCSMGQICRYFVHQKKFHCGNFHSKKKTS